MCKKRNIYQILNQKSLHQSLNHMHACDASGITTDYHILTKVERNSFFFKFLSLLQAFGGLKMLSYS